MYEGWDEFTDAKGVDGPTPAPGKNNRVPGYLQPSWMVEYGYRIGSYLDILSTNEQ